MLPLAVNLEHDVVHDDEDLHILTWGAVLVNRWRVTPSKAKLQLLGQHQRRLAEATVDRRILVVTVLSPGVGLLLTAEARKEAEAVAAAGREYLFALAQVVEGEGFIAAAARAVMSGVQLAVRAGYPVKVFGRVDEALPWVSDQLRAKGQVRDADEVMDVLLPLVDAERGG